MTYFEGATAVALVVGIGKGLAYAYFHLLCDAGVAAFVVAEFDPRVACYGC